jgi:deoxyribonuclease IV
MKFGIHVSIAGGIENAPLNAHKRQADTFQMFSRSPRGGKPTYTKDSIEEFKKRCQEYGFDECYIHTPYYINLASSTSRILKGSITSIREELEIGTQLGVTGVMTHLGSSKDYTRKEAIDLVVKGIDEIMKGYKGTTQLLIENAAGAGQIMGDTFEEIGYILKKVKYKNVGVCLDTCHAFASGYDIRTKASLDKTVTDFDKHIGLDKLKLFHMNDSKVELDSHKDRHEVIGKGFIGEKAFATFINHPKLKNISAILETPDVGEEKIPSLKLVKKLKK